MTRPVDLKATFKGYKVSLTSVPSYGESPGEDVREELLLKSSNVMPMSNSKFAYLGFEKCLHVTDSKIWDMIKKQNLTLLSLPANSKSLKGGSRDFSLLHASLLELQSPGAAPIIKEEEPDITIKLNPDGSLVMKLKQRVHLVPPSFVLIDRLSDELIERVIERPKCANFSDPFYTALGARSLTKLKSLESQEQTLAKHHEEENKPVQTQTHIAKKKSHAKPKSLTTKPLIAKKQSQNHAKPKSNFVPKHPVLKAKPLKAKKQSQNHAEHKSHFLPNMPILNHQPLIAKKQSQENTEHKSRFLPDNPVSRPRIPKKQSQLPLNPVLNHQLQRQLVSLDQPLVDTGLVKSFRANETMQCSGDNQINIENIGDGSKLTSEGLGDRIEINMARIFENGHSSEGAPAAMEDNTMKFWGDNGQIIIKDIGDGSKLTLEGLVDGIEIDMARIFENGYSSEGAQEPMEMEDFPWNTSKADVTPQPQPTIDKSLNADDDDMDVLQLMVECDDDFL